MLESRRQYDDAVLATSGEHPGARPVGGVFGLQLVIHRGLTIGWAIGLLIAGAAFGSMTKSLLDAARGNALIARVISTQGADGAYTTMTQFLAAATTAYVVTVIVRLSRDEESGLGEAVLAGSVSRWVWLLSAVGAALTGAAVLLACAGFGNGLGTGLTLGEPHTIVRLTLAALAFLPAMAAVAAVAALGVALCTARPRLAGGDIRDRRALSRCAASPAALAARRLAGGRAPPRRRRYPLCALSCHGARRHGNHSGRGVAVPPPRCHLGWHWARSPPECCW